jgi:hypothetical protein
MSPYRSFVYRNVERIMAVVLFIFALRIALPIGSSQVYTNQLMKIMFALLVAAPGVWLLFVRSAKNHVKALFSVMATYTYLTVTAMIVDWTRFGGSAASLGFAAVGLILYAGARAERRHR